MVENFLTQQIFAQLPFAPNNGQAELIDKLSRFVLDQTQGKMFILRGYAGTGKTSVTAALVRTLHSLHQPIVLLAPTGRAAKVLSKHANAQPAYTIHKYIYRIRQLGAEQFGSGSLYTLGQNTVKNTLFIVDEASMLSNSHDDSPFGNSLLDDLLRFVYTTEGCSLLLIGDTAQLPPVGQTFSPALDEAYMRRQPVPNLHITTHTLTKVARQALHSTILSNATRLREDYLQDNLQPKSLPPFFFTPQSGKDLLLLEGKDLQLTLERAYEECGAAQVLVVTRTNRRTNLYNQGIRAHLLFREGRLSSGDRVMVCHNNYFLQSEEEPFVANGEMFEVERLRRERELYGFRFADATLRNIDTDRTLDATVWLDTLTADDDAQIRQMHRTLFDRVAEDFPEITNRRKLVEAVYASPYYNALQIRYAYAVTCHKAQGGQWQRVFIDQGPVPDERRDLSYLRWLYTALTRATETVYLVNFK